MSIAEKYGWHWSLWNWNNTPDFNYVHLDQTYGTHYMDSILVHLNKKSTSVREVDSRPESFSLLQNYPNPFNPQTTIRFTVPRLSVLPAHMKLRIYDLRGRLVETLLDGTRSAGTHSIIWNGKNSEGRVMATGIYIYELVVGKTRVRRKMMLLR